MKQLKLDQSEEYVNTLNNLSGKEWKAFLPTSTAITVTYDDMQEYKKNWSKPRGVVNDLISFFSKEGSTVLDVFSGRGTNLFTLDSMGRVGVGLESDAQKVADMRAAIASDAFLPDFHVVEQDVFEGLDTLHSMFANTLDFVLIDAPLPNGKASFEGDLAGQNPKDFVDSMAEVVRRSLKLLQPGKFVALMVNDSYFEKRYFPIAGMVAGIVRARGIKNYHRSDVQHSFLGGGQSYIPQINHFSAVLFRREDEE